MKRIAIFASGKGTNAERLIRNFEGHRDAQVTLVVSNRADAGVLEVAKTFGVETLVVDRENFYNNN
ncbi:MAG TPA: formyltransferase family protein, partial [Bacteroidia bacterium]|nr:formyltransferase family protein [Bacteroidia bacterium]